MAWFFQGDVLVQLGLAAKVGEEIGDPARGDIAAVGISGLVDRLPERLIWVAFCGLDELIKNRAQARNPPVEVVGL